MEGQLQACVERLDHPGGHLRGGVPIAGADAAATLQLPTATALVAHELIDDPRRDAGVLQPGREAVPKIVGSAQLQMLKVGASTLDSTLVEAAKAVARQGRPGATGHAVATAGASGDQGEGSMPGGSWRRMASTTTGARGSSRMAASLLGRGLNPLPNRPAW
jgi:hypothetical protein